MGRSELAAQQRMQLEAVLEQFEDALRDSTDGILPDVNHFLSGLEGESRHYLEQEMRALLRDTVRGNYLVLNPIESGGMGSVSKVRHLRLGKVMALKEIRAEALQIGDRNELLRRFQREIEVCGRLDEHPNVVSYTDTGVNEAGAPFLVMDFIDGEDLGKIVRRAGPLSIPNAAQVIHDAAVGLAHAHDHGLIHRDVKPSNVMISRHGTVKVLDFGLARIATGDRRLTALTTGKVMGTFDYMSPELCRETTPDHRGDLYSLGCTFYFVLAGRAPFEEARSQYEKMDAHLHAQPPVIPRLAEQSELQAILQRMMAKRPEDRFQHAQEVADALRPFCVRSDLRSLVRSTRSPGEPGAGSSASATDRRAPDSSDRTTNSKAADKTAEWTRYQRSRVRRVAITAVLVASGLALLASLLVADHWQRTEHRRQLANVLGTLPGLNGRWWFDEAPWLLPDVRLELINSLADADESTRQQLLTTVLADARVPEAYEQLEKTEDRLKEHWPRDVRAHLADVVAFDPEDANPSDFAQSLGNTATSLDSKREPLTAAESHLRAVIHHYQQELEPALRLYEEAARKYYQEDQPALRALALLDCGELLHGFRQPARAHSKFNRAWSELADALEGEPLPPLFELYAKGMEADCHRRLEHWEDAASLLARCAEIAGTLPDNHPLRAFVLERRGWLNLDLWQLEEATDDFERALTIRRSQEPENHRARHFIYWNLQGLGMAKTYSGEPEAARQEFQTLLDQLEQIDDASSRITARQRTELEDRRPNLYERLADTALFSGSDEFDGVTIDPAEELESAIEFAEDSNFDRDGRKAVLIRLEYKAAAVRAMRGALTEAIEHRKTAEELEAPAESSAADSAAEPSGRLPVFELTKRIALAALDWRSESPREHEAGRDELLAAIKRSAAGSGLPRDDLLLLLYVGENLLESKELTPEEQAALSRWIQQLIGAQSFPPLNPADEHSPPRIPGLLERYLDLAKSMDG